MRQIGRAWNDWYASLHAAAARARGALPDADLAARLRRARRAIESRMDERLDLDTLARTACYSRYHFLRLFQNEIGTTPHQYLIERRIARARDLLSWTNLSVTEICMEVGFSSVGSFTSLFRRMTGRPPTHFRRRIVQVNWQRRLAVPGCFARMLDRNFQEAHVGARC